MPAHRDHPSALIDWQGGQPISRLFADVYFSGDSGIEETRHVFLGGNRLRERWSHLGPHAHVTIGETGFGTGLNFACAWQLWDQVAPPGARLSFASVERYPLAAADVGRALGLWPELARYRDALLAQWDDFAPGWHRLRLGDRVRLTLLVGDVRTTLPRLDTTVDAWFLDGFAPARNPEMWQPEVFAEVARLSRAGATCATYSVAGAVRRGLEAAGFTVEKTPGFGRKREMLRGSFAPSRLRRWYPPWFARPDLPTADRRAVVIGAGLAGTATAASLAARGWTIDLVDRHAGVAAEASGNPQGMLYARPSPHATALGELATAGLQYTCRSLPRLPLEPSVDFNTCGVLQLAYDADEALRHARLAALGLPSALLAPLDRAEASARVGIELPSGGLFFPRAGWVRPPALCLALIADPRIRLTLNREALQISRSAGGWTVADGAGAIADAPVVIIAGAGASSSFAATRHLPFRLIRGQLTLVPQTPASRALQTVLCGAGYVAPAYRGTHSLGATHRFRDTSTASTAAEHAENLAKLARLAPALFTALGADRLDPARLSGRAALRCSAPDYLPIIGPVVEAAAFHAAYAPLARDAKLELDAPSPWLAGLYVNTAHGSRGLITAPLAAELLAAYLEDEPMPLPRPVLEAVHPSRFLLRALIRRRPRLTDVRQPPSPGG